jgi:hypothetical protein
MTKFDGEYRHCAKCLKELTNASLCGQCKFRSYCSKECQTLDWKKGSFQGHKSWCNLKCGEEDVDWKVTPVPGKGLGLEAKRLFKSGERIMVDCVRTINDPVVAQLMPIDGTLVEKERLNSLSHEGVSRIAARVSRANHSCNSNAFHWSDETFKVIVLVARKDIQPGEEITISYTNFDDISQTLSSNFARGILENKWGIICPSDCYCRQDSVNSLVAKMKALDRSVYDKLSSGNANDALTDVKKLLSLYGTTNLVDMNLQRTYYDAFQVCITKRKTLRQGLEYLKKSTNIMSFIVHPDSEDLIRFKDLLVHPEHHRSHLLLER